MPQGGAAIQEGNERSEEGSRVKIRPATIADEAAWLRIKNDSGSPC